MSASDLLFIGAFLASIAVALRLVYLLSHARFPAAQRLALRWAASAGAYISILLAFSVAQPMRVLPRGAPWCFDDWCIAVDSVGHPEAIAGLKPAGQWVLISMTVSSRMLRSRQSEPDAFVYLRDRSGKRYLPSDVGMRAVEELGTGGRRITDFVEPGGSFQSVAVFDVPANIEGLAFVKERRSRFPGIMIIGDPVSLFHRPTVIPID